MIRLIKQRRRCRRNNAVSGLFTLYNHRYNITGVPFISPGERKKSDIVRSVKLRLLRARTAGEKTSAIHLLMAARVPTFGDLNLTGFKRVCRFINDRLNSGRAVLVQSGEIHSEYGSCRCDL